MPNVYRASYIYLCDMIAYRADKIVFVVEKISILDFNSKSTLPVAKCEVPRAQSQPVNPVHRFF